jgi:hypothetical protein
MHARQSHHACSSALVARMSPAVSTQHFLARLHSFVSFPAGVSGKGVVELQAQLYRTQEHARLRAEGLVDVKDKHVPRKAGTAIPDASQHALCNPRDG